MKTESIAARHQTSHTEEKPLKLKMLRIQMNHLAKAKKKKKA